MKVIGTTLHGYLLEADATEVNQLAGKSISDRDCYGSPFIPVGTRFDVNKAYQQLQHNKSRKDDLERVKTILNGIVAHLSLVEPFMEEPQGEKEKAVGE